MANMISAAVGIGGFLLGLAFGVLAARRSVVVKIGPHVEIQAGSVSEMKHLLATIQAAGTLAQVQEFTKGVRVQ